MSFWRASNVVVFPILIGIIFLVAEFVYSQPVKISQHCKTYLHEVPYDFNSLAIKPIWAGGSILGKVSHQVFESVSNQRGPSLFSNAKNQQLISFPFKQISIGLYFLQVCLS
jgi:hypothetical protein